MSLINLNRINQQIIKQPKQTENAQKASPQFSVSADDIARADDSVKEFKELAISSEQVLQQTTKFETKNDQQVLKGLHSMVQHHCDHCGHIGDIIKTLPIAPGTGMVAASAPQTAPDTSPEIAVNLSKSFFDQAKEILDQLLHNKPYMEDPKDNCLLDKKGDRIERENPKFDTGKAESETNVKMLPVTNKKDVPDGVEVKKNPEYPNITTSIMDFKLLWGQGVAMQTLANTLNGDNVQLIKSSAQ